MSDRALLLEVLRQNDLSCLLCPVRKSIADGLSGNDALSAAFEQNARDVARIGGS
jgi:glutamate synthase (ferredoxin)